MKINKFTLATLLVLIQLISACGVLPKEEEFPSSPVIREYEGANYGKTKVVKGDLIDSVNVKVQYLGTTIRELQHTEERKVEKVYAKEGIRVKSGDVLIQYDMQEEQDQYDEVEYNLKVVGAKIRHQKELMALELKKQREVGADKKSIQSVKAAYSANIKQMESNQKIYRIESQEAKKALRQCVLKAPISGVITYMEPEMKGKLAVLGKKIIKIEGEKKDYFTAKTEYAKYFKEGMTTDVTILKDNYPATVKKKSGNSKTIYFYPKKKASNIATGKFGTIKCVLREKKDVLYLPSSVIYKMDNKNVVYVEEENGLKKAVEVKIGIEFNNLTEIAAGLKEEDEVITN